MSQSPDNAERWYEPTTGWHIGRRALDVLIELDAPAPMPLSTERRWYVSDHNALLAVTGFETRLKLKGLAREAPADVRTEISDALDSWHAALPFSESEREIVRHAYEEGSQEALAYREVPGALRRQEFNIVSAGVRRVVSGRDPMRRWWAWRRELDEYEGQDTLHQARAAVTAIAGRLIRPENMPDIFYDLQVFTRPMPLERD